MSSNTSWATRKFFASTSGGVCANQSVSSSVLLSDWALSSKAMTNSAPSGPSPCRECGAVDRIRPFASAVPRLGDVPPGQALMNSSRSALMVSAWVVGMPCGKPW